MFEIDKNNVIKMVQGDTGSIRLKLLNYSLGEGDEVRFGAISRHTACSAKSSEDHMLAINKVITKFERDGSAVIFLEALDTLDLPPGNYLYEIQVKTNDGRIDTVIPTTRLVIMEGIIHG